MSVDANDQERLCKRRSADSECRVILNVQSVSFLNVQSGSECAE